MCFTVPHHLVCVKGYGPRTVGAVILINCFYLLCTYQCNMPHYPRHGLRWGKVGICVPENYNSPPSGEVLAIQTPTYPDKSPSSETRAISGDRRRGVRHLYKSRTPCQQINSKSTRTNHKSICKWEFQNINISQKYWKICKFTAASACAAKLVLFIYFINLFSFTVCIQ